LYCTKEALASYFTHQPVEVNAVGIKKCDKYSHTEMIYILLPFTWMILIPNNFGDERWPTMNTCKITDRIFPISLIQLDKNRVNYRNLSGDYEKFQNIVNVRIIYG
jgi:hypothetical protein